MMKRRIFFRFDLVFSAAALLAVISIIPSCRDAEIPAPPLAYGEQKSPLVGQWITTDDDSGKDNGIVEIYETNGKYYGKVVKLLLPEDQGRVFEKGEGEDKGKPIVGLVILKNLVEANGEYTDGTITDPNSGSVYDCTIEFYEDLNTLKVRGFINVSIIGRTQYWRRVVSEDSAGSNEQSAGSSSITHTIALAKKSDQYTQVSLSGKIFVFQKRIYLQDSTGLILLKGSEPKLKSIAASDGDDVTVTGVVKKGFWSEFGFKDPELIVTGMTHLKSTDTQPDTGTKKQ